LIGLVQFGSRPDLSGEFGLAGCAGNVGCVLGARNRVGKAARLRESGGECIKRSSVVGFGQINSARRQADCFGSVANPRIMTGGENSREQIERFNPIRV
jgi:hypothetical protein